jgi:hypothetical protein
VLLRVSTHPAIDIDAVLPDRWKPPSTPLPCQRRPRSDGYAAENPPIFFGRLGADLTFLGFPFSEEDALGATDYFFPNSFYVVLEERVSEARFGMDEAGQGGTLSTSIENWDQLDWDTSASSERAAPPRRYRPAATWMPWSRP